MREIEVVAWIDLCGAQTALFTYPRVYQLLDGSNIGWNLYTLVETDGVYTDAVQYGYMSEDGFGYDEAIKYLDNFGVSYVLDYDTEAAVLTVRLLPGEEES